MPGLEDTLNNKNEQNEKLPQNPESQETVESVEDMRKRISQEITAQHEQLKGEDAKIETANNSIGLSVEEVQEEKNAMNLDAEISVINIEAEKLINEPEIEALVRGTLNVASLENGSKNEADGLNSIFESNPKLSEIGTKEQYEAYIQNRFPREAAKNLGEGYIQTSINSFFEDAENQEGVEEVEKNFLKNYVTMMSDEDLEKVKPYKTSESSTINSLLREGKQLNLENILQYKGMNPHQPQYILDNLNGIAEACDTMKESIKKSYWSPHESVFNDSKTYRVDFTGHLAQKNIGDVVDDKAFISTSIDKNQYAIPNLKSDKDSTIIIMNFPKNSIVNAVYLAGKEKELLLPPNMSYEIKDKKIVQINGAAKTVMNVEFLPNENIHILGSEKDAEDFKSFVSVKNNSEQPPEGVK